MRIVLFLAILANSLDLVLTAFGIHLFGNREGNPLLSGMAHQHWIWFVIVKGIVVPALILRLHHMRRTSPTLASAGLALVTLALTVALGQWIGWMAGVLHVAAFTHL